MENREMWEAAGMAKRISRGLKQYLDARAEEMLYRTYT
jgi:hypothetical protein